MDPVLVLDLSPNCGLPGVGYIDAAGGGKDILNPVGISEKNHAKTQRERERPTHTKSATIHY